MSAVIQNEYTGNNSTTTYSFTFPYLKTSDIKASLDGVDTTAFTLPNATTLQFNTAPTNGAKIKIFRQTSVDNLTATFYAGSAIKSEDLNDNFTQNLYKTQEIGGRFISALGGTMTGDLNMGEDTVIKFEGATDDAHETTLTVADPTADRTITLPNVTGTVVTTGDTGTVATGMIAGDAVTGDKIADDQINSEHYVDGSIDTQHIADAQVTTAKIADSNVTTGKLAADAVTAAKLADNAVVTANIVDANVTTAKIAADAVTNAKIADNSIDSEHYVDESIDNAHLANNSVTLSKMADDSVGTAELVDGSVDTARLADNSVTLAKMTDDSVGTSEIVDAAVTTAKIADNAVTMAKLASGTLPTDITVASANLVDGTIATADIADNAITSGKIATGAVDSTDIGSGVIDTVHIGSSQVTTAKIADSNITTAKITDANVTTAKIANDAITIGKLGCEQTTLSDSDSHIPTSGAVVDYVAAQLAPLGGLEVIATEIAFPNTQPSSGVVISISDAGGVVVNGSGVSTTGRTVGGSTVTINGFPASLQSKTMAADLGLMVSSTGSSQTYTYHKLLAKEADVEQLSNDINDFAARYRVGSSNPTSDLDAGDLFFNTGTSKLLVYNATNSAWEEAQSIGNFFISTFSEAFDGSRTQFTLSNAPANAQQIILSLNGVVQKPGTAFTLSGSTVTLASAPASGTDYFAVVMGSTVNIGTPSNNTVSTAVLQDDSVTTAKIAASNVTATELGANAVITSKIADDAVTAAKLASNAVVNASVDASAAIARTKLANVDVVDDTSPQLGGDLDTNSHHILIDDDHQIKFGNGNDYQIYHDGTNSIQFFDAQVGGVRFRTDVGNSARSNIILGAGVDLYHSNSKKFETTSSGAQVTGEFNHLAGTYTNGSGGNIKIAHDSGRLTLGGGDDYQIYHNGTNAQNDNATGNLEIRNTGTFGSTRNIYLRAKVDESSVTCKSDGAVELYYNNNIKFETLDTGNQSTGVHKLITGSGSTSSDDNVVHIVAGGTADRGIKIGTGRATGSSQNDGMGFIDAINAESGGYGSQLQLRVNGNKVMVVGHQGNNRVGINELNPSSRLHVTDDSEAESIKTVHSNGTAGIGIGYNTIRTLGSNTNQEMYIRAKGNEKLRLGANNNDVLGIEKDSRDVRFFTNAQGWSTQQFNMGGNYDMRVHRLSLIHI